MIIVGTVSYPTEHSKEVAKRLGGLPPLPPYMTTKGPYVTSELGSGIKGMVIFEFDQSKTREAIEYVGNRYAKYIGVPGLTYSFSPWMEIKEALAMIGMA